MAEAAKLIRAGGLVAFPTETVYGLGANALDAAAVARIYAAKGRPATSPLIVHCADKAMARQYAAVWPEAAERLATAFWPGPLTLVLEKSPLIPANVTAGLGTVGLRVPKHPVALALLRAAGVPIAAPSANPFQGLSPTLASHIPARLADLILEGGASEVGIESTVLSLVGPPTLLRPGMISLAELERVLGAPIRPAADPQEPHASPGLHAQHYSPLTPFTVLAPGTARPPGRGIVLEMPADPETYAQRLYAALHEADHQGWEWIAVAAPPDTPLWDAIRDRLSRAQHR
ncbi:MAG: threonylcarbamoyl-AMP synthase [Bryobacteraceae bacterium]|nr:threonylcarbamoyl-AMP synthase [Bryobacteraceae bacterium]